MTVCDSSSGADTALARAVVYRLLSVAFEPPADVRLHEIGARHGFAAVVAALRYLEAGAGGDRGLGTAAERLASTPVPDARTLSSTFWRLFGHTTRGPICACETEYGPDNGFHQPHQLADIAGYYLAFGVRPAEVGEARPDHIACELEFMDLLCRKRALLIERRRAGAADLAETLEVTAMAARSFLRNHLGRFARAVGARLDAEDPRGFYGAVGGVLAAFVASECARAGVDAGAIDVAVRPADVDDAPMACTSGDQLIQIQRRP